MLTYHYLRLPFGVRWKVNISLYLTTPSVLNIQSSDAIADFACSQSANLTARIKTFTPYLILPL